MLYVVAWVSYGSEYPDGDVNLKVCTSAVVEAIRKGKYCFSGTYHQYGNTGCPVLSDGTAARYSMRGWGRVMALACDDYTETAYAQFAWSLPKGLVEHTPPQQPQLCMF